MTGKKKEGRRKDKMDKNIRIRKKKKRRKIMEKTKNKEYHKTKKIGERLSLSFGISFA